MFHKRPRYTVGNQVCVYDGTTSTQAGLSKNDAEVMLKSKLSLKWTSPFKILPGVPCASTLHGEPFCEMLLYLALLSRIGGEKAKIRVSVVRRKSYLEYHDSDDRSRYLPAVFTKYAL